MTKSDLNLFLLLGRTYFMLSFNLSSSMQSQPIDLVNCDTGDVAEYVCSKLLSAAIRVINFSQVAMTVVAEIPAPAKLVCKTADFLKMRLDLTLFICSLTAFALYHSPLDKTRDKPTISAIKPTL